MLRILHDLLDGLRERQSSRKRENCSDLGRRHSTSVFPERMGDGEISLIHMVDERYATTIDGQLLAVHMPSTEPSIASAAEKTLKYSRECGAPVITDYTGNVVVVDPYFTVEEVEAFYNRGITHPIDAVDAYRDIVKGRGTRGSKEPAAEAGSEEPERSPKFRQREGDRRNPPGGSDGRTV